MCGRWFAHLFHQRVRRYELSFYFRKLLIDDNWKDKNVVEGFTTGKVNDLWNEGGHGNAIVRFFKIKDMGDLGEDLKKIGGITDNTEVDAVLSFINNEVKVEP